MLKSLSSGVSGLRSHQTMLDVIANNVANVNTAGFKASRVTFTDVFYQTLASATGPTATAGGTNGIQIGSGTAVSTIDMITTQGGYSQTDKQTDLYISGEGYLVIQDSAGNVAYTRVGNLSFDPSGNLVDSNGNHVMGVNLATLPAYDPADPTAITLADLSNITVANYSTYSSIAIGGDGIITGVDSAGVSQTLGQIALAAFTNPAGLSQEGSLYMSATPNSGEAIYSPPGSSVTGTFVTGGLEMSNVDLSQQLTNMIIAQRGFQANSRIITTSDEVLQELVNLKR